MISEIFGYVGAGLLIIRFTPLIVQMFKRQDIDMNPLFLIIELLAGTSLTVSAILISAYQFVVCSGCTVLITLMLLIYSATKNKSCSKLSPSPPIPPSPSPR